MQTLGTKRMQKGKKFVKRVQLLNKVCVKRISARIGFMHGMK